MCNHIKHINHDVSACLVYSKISLSAMNVWWYIMMWDASVFFFIHNDELVWSLCRCRPSGMHSSNARQLWVKLPHVSSTFITVWMAVPSQLFPLISLQLQFSLLPSPPSSSSVCVCVRDSCCRQAFSGGGFFRLLTALSTACCICTTFH